MENNTKNKDQNALKNMSGVFGALVSKKNTGDGNALEVNNLSFSVKRRLLLNKITFAVKQGEIHGFIGPNGAGKTTTIKNIIDAYVTRTKESEIKIMGYKSTTLEAKKHVAYIPEYAAFPTHLSLLNYLKAMAGFNGLSSTVAKTRSLELIKILELEPHKNINPNKFSSGMKKKVLLAQALMSDPSILILDEPAANLDPAARNMFFKSIKTLANHGVTIFISSHILAELEGLIDSITLINHGNVLYSGTVKNMIKSIKSNDKEFYLNIYGDKKELNKTIVLVKKNKLKFEEEPAFIKIRSENKKKLFKLIGEISKKEIEIDSVAFDKVTLQDIYNKEFTQ